MTSAPTRRSLFSAAAAITIGSGVTAGSAASAADLVQMPSTDAQIVAIGVEARQVSARYEGMLAKWWDLNVGDPGLESCAAEMNVPHDRLCDMAERARDIPTSTPEGWQAKAVLIRHLMSVEYCTDGKMQFETFEQEIMWSLICDMTGRPA